MKRPKQVKNENSGESSSNIDLLFDPDREVGKEFHLYHRSDTKNLPKSDKRCQSCERSFTNIDVLVAKTHGVREYFCGKSKEKKQTEGNIYLYFLSMSLSKYDRSYNIQMIRVPRCTAEMLPKNVVEGYKKKGMKFL